MRPPKVRDAVESDAAAIAGLRNAAANRLTREYGAGHWSGQVSERSVLTGIRMCRVLVAVSRRRVVATLRLATKKPWAIDSAYFVPAKKPLYLIDMAVAPPHQGKGIGRLLLKEAEALARAWPAESIRLDAYAAAAGAGGFYAKCGYREVGRVVYRGVPLAYFERLLDRDEAAG